jgi:hypothetical protein
MLVLGSVSDADLIDEAFGYLKRINPSLTDADRIDAKAGRKTPLGVREAADEIRDRRPAAGGC